MTDWLDFQARRFIPTDEDERLVTCPKQGCGQFLVPTDLVLKRSEIVCPSCSMSLCAGCSREAHSGMTCDAAEEHSLDPEIRKLIAKEVVSELWDSRKRCLDRVAKL